MTRFTHAALAAAALGLVLAGPAPADVLDPLDSGEKLLFLVTGVQNDETTDITATVFWCTNIGKADVEVTVDISDDFGNTTGSNTQTLSVGETDSWATQSVGHLVGEIQIATPSWSDHGSARITALGKGAKLLCVAAVMDPAPESSEPTAYMNLPVTPIGKPVTKIPVRKN